MNETEVDPEIVSLAAHALSCEFKRQYVNLVQKFIAASKCFDDDTQQEVEDRIADDSNWASACFAGKGCAPESTVKITGESGKEYGNMMEAVSADPPEPIIVDGVKYFTLKNGELYWAQ